MWYVNFLKVLWNKNLCQIEVISAEFWVLPRRMNSATFCACISKHCGCSPSIQQVSQINVFNMLLKGAALQDKIPLLKLKHIEKQFPSLSSHSVLCIYHSKTSAVFLTILDSLSSSNNELGTPCFLVKWPNCVKQNSTAAPNTPFF